jgi:hypothetical protein
MKAGKSTAKRLVVGVAGLLMASAGSTALASPASAGIPPTWEHKTSICQTVSFYSQNPAYNPGVSPTHALGGHKKFYFTTGPVVNGWMPVYSAGQEDWHTGWVRGECMTPGWGYPDDGYVIY